MQVKVKVYGEFTILPPYSEPFDSSSCICELPYAEYFCNIQFADSILFTESHTKEVTDEIPLHFHLIPEIERLKCYLTEIEPSNMDENQLKKVTLSQTPIKLYRLNEAIHPTAFRAILRFFYRREVPIHDLIVADIYQIAYDCDLIFIAKACIYPFLKINTALQLLPAVFKKGDADDKAIVLNFIGDRKNCDKILQEAYFYNLSPEIVKLITNLEYLKVPEDQLVKAVKGWAKHQLKKRNKEAPLDLESISHFLDEHEIYDNIRVTLLTGPEKILPPRDLEWLIFARSSACRKKLKYQMSNASHKRNGPKISFSQLALPE